MCAWKLPFNVSSCHEIGVDRYTRNLHLCYWAYFRLDSGSTRSQCMRLNGHNFYNCFSNTSEWNVQTKWAKYVSDACLRWSIGELSNAKIFVSWFRLCCFCLLLGEISPKSDEMNGQINFQDELKMILPLSDISRNSSLERHRGRYGREKTCHFSSFCICCLISLFNLI